jgi:hypothetical protein
MIKFLRILSRYEAAEFSQVEAAELVGEGQAGVPARPPASRGRWRCRASRPAAGPGLRQAGSEVEALCRTYYAGFTAKHFHADLGRDHDFAWGYSRTNTFLHSRGLLERAKRRGAHRKRPPRPMAGMMLHQPFDATAFPRHCHVIPMAEDMTLAAAIGGAVHHAKHPLGPVAGGTDNAATAPAPIDHRIARSRGSDVNP